jgi:hypothetical protein
VPRRRAPAQATAGHVAFASDTAERRSVTSPSIRKQGGRRKVLTFVGAGGIAALVALVAVVKGSASPHDSAAVATNHAAPSAMPLPAAPPPSAADPVQTPAASSASAVPVVPAIAVDALPPARPRQSTGTGNATPPRKSSAPAPSKKHFSVLDSPD